MFKFFYNVTGSHVFEMFAIEKNISGMSLKKKVFSKVFNISESLISANSLEFNDSKPITIGTTQRFNFNCSLISSSPLAIDYGYWTSPDLITQYEGNYF